MTATLLLAIAAGLVLILTGVRRFRTRRRTAIALPAWFTLWTALPFGALLTGADLPPRFRTSSRSNASSMPVSHQGRGC
jgi:hypothetical protein